MRRVSWKPRPMFWALILCAGVGGCAATRSPGVDPTGQRAFVPSHPGEPYPAREVPGSRLPTDNADLVISQKTSAAPIGSEVILVAGVRGPDQYLRMNERVEWTLEPGGVGQFVDFDRHGCSDWFVGDFTAPKKIAPGHVVTSTSREYLRLTCGTATPEDDVTVLRGQTWVSVMSPAEGTSYITALAPSVYGWDRRLQTAMVHWFDAHWQFPAPAINAAGTRHTFTTTVVRISDQSPRPGWRVRYSIAGGPAAGFAPSGGQTIEIETDAAGRASAEIFQSRPAPGTNTVTVQVLRPPGPGRAGGAIVVGTGSTTKTWSAPGLALRVAGPAVGSVGATLSYRLEVSNPGDLPVEGIAVSDELPDGLSYLRSNPPAQASGRTLRWQLARVAPRDCCTVHLDVRADRAGIVSHCAEAATAAGLRARECATTTISVAPPGPPLTPGASSPPGPTPATASPGNSPLSTQPPSKPLPGTPPAGPPAVAAPAPLDVKYTGAERATVGDTVTFDIQLTNRGPAPLSKLELWVRLDPGLEAMVESAAGKSTIRRPLNVDLQPGQPLTVPVELRAVRAGRLCSSVEVLGAGLRGVTAEKCLQVAERSARKAEPPKPTRSLNNLSVKVATPNLDAPAAVFQDGVAEFEIVVKNVGQEPLGKVALRCNLDPGLIPREATGGNRWDEKANTVTWQVGPLAAGQSLSFGLACKATRLATSACCQATAVADEGDQAQGQACVEVRPPAPPAAEGLVLNVESLRETVSARQEFSFLIRVANRGTATHKNVTITATLTPASQVLPVPLGTTGPTSVTIKGQSVQFEPLPQLFAGMREEYRVRVLARQPGEGQIRVEVTSSSLTRPLLGEAKATIQQQER